MIKWVGTLSLISQLFYLPLGICLYVFVSFLYALCLDKCDIINPLIYVSSQGRFPEDHRHMHCPDPKNLYV